MKKTMDSLLDLENMAQPDMQVGLGFERMIM